MLTFKLFLEISLLQFRGNILRDSLFEILLEIFLRKTNVQVALQTTTLP